MIAPFMTAEDPRLCFGMAIKRKRSEMGISQEELADRAGLHRTYISDVERGVRNLSLESIDKLARALKLSISSLFEPSSGADIGKRMVDILLVEDNPQDVELTQRAFRKARITNPLHVVRDGEEALDFLFKTDRSKKVSLPGVILLDLELPKISGLEVLRRIKAEACTSNIPVIVLTASRNYQYAVECRRLGVSNYIVKPVSFFSLGEVTPHLKFDWALVNPHTL